jgi:hypothetical protein
MAYVSRGQREKQAAIRLLKSQCLPPMSEMGTIPRLYRGRAIRRILAMNSKNTVIGVIVVIVLLLIVGWAAGWFGGTQAPAPTTTTEQPAPTQPTTTDQGTTTNQGTTTTEPTTGTGTGTGTTTTQP